MNLKLTHCPYCDSTDIGDRWIAGRRLQQFCCEDECNWKGIPRIPEKKPIVRTMDIYPTKASGWHFTTYDKYGHESCYSKTYGNKRSAMKALKEELLIHDAAIAGGPYQGVLFFVPGSIVIKGTLFKIKNGVCRSSKKITT